MNNPEKYKNKYRSSSSRLAWWDYGRNGSYFVTLCTKNREHFFGGIKDYKMELSELGLIARKYWNEIPQHFPFVKLDEFIIMPDHIHGIIIIDKYDDPTYADTDNMDHYIDEQQKWKPGTLGVIINQYKRICTINARAINPDFAWQTRFYDSIIRDKKSFNIISKYIRNNPEKWQG